MYVNDSASYRRRYGDSSMVERADHARHVPV